MLNFKKNTINNVCLVGLMGSGKSVIGRDLSRKYNANFIDTDNEIEKETGKSIKDIFVDHGETYFRDLEEKICLQVLKNKNCVISLGGGSVLNNKIRSSIKKNSYSIFINVKINLIIKRLGNSKKRPLLNEGNKEEILKELYKERIEYYNDSDLIISNDLDKIDIIKKIDEKLREI